MTNNGDASASSLWGIIIALFLILLLFILHAIFQGSYSLCSRFCTFHRYACFCCYCSLDVEGYRRERESLRRLRELHRTNAFRQQLALQTYSQIPGPVPNSLDFVPSASLMRAYEAFGFILVPQLPVRPIDLTSAQFRDQLTVEQRRTILEQLLVCHEYHDSKEAPYLPSSDSLPTVVSTPTQQPQPIIVQSDTVTTATATLTIPTISPPHTITEEMRDAEQEYIPDLSPNLVFPPHEEPGEEACAICLDHFQQGEAITSQARCCHSFHKNCLMEWLDEHSVCPCCRASMISESEWKQAAMSSGIPSRTTTDFEVPTGSVSPTPPN